MARLQKLGLLSTVTGTSDRLHFNVRCQHTGCRFLLRPRNTKCSCKTKRTGYLFTRPLRHCLSLGLAGHRLPSAISYTTRSAFSRLISAAGEACPMKTETENPGPKIPRTSAGLRDALFDAIERVRDQRMRGEDALALANVAGQICKTVQLEIEVAKLRTEYPADTKLVIPAPLAMGPSVEK